MGNPATETTLKQNAMLDISGFSIDNKDLF